MSEQINRPHRLRLPPRPTGRKPTGVPLSPSEMIRQSLRLLTYHRRRIWWITSRVFILTVVLTALALAFQPKYVARAKLTLLPTRSELGYASVRPETWGLSPAALLGQTHVEGLLSRTLAEDVARTLQADASEELRNGGALGFIRRRIVGPVMGSFHRVLTLLDTGRWQSPDPFTSLVDCIRGATEVQNVPGSFVFEVGVTWRNPKLAAMIANLLTEHHVERTLQANREEMSTTRKYLEERIVETEADLDSLVSQIKEYRAAERVYTVRQHSSSDVDLGLQDLSQYLRDYNISRASRAELEARISTLKPYQTPAALATIEAEREGLQTRQKVLEEVISEQIAKLDKLPAKEAGLLDLYRERLIKERALNALEDRLLDSRVAEAAQLSAVRVIDPAIAPIYPERPRLVRNAVVSIFVGLLLSVGFVLSVEARKPGLRSRHDLGADVGAAVALLPFTSTNGHFDPDSEEAGGFREFFRGLVHGRYGTVAHHRAVKRHLEHIMVQLVHGGNPRVCMLVSLNGGEGKTFIIEKLAQLAREADQKILLVDGNMSDPGLHDVFGKPMTDGLAEMLAGEAMAADVIVQVDANVDLICAGTRRLHSHARWAVQKVKREIEACLSEYDLILIESAALRHDPSAVRLLPLAAEVHCVFDARTSLCTDPDEVRSRLGSAAAGMGCLLNQVLHSADYLYTPSANGRKARRAGFGGRLRSRRRASLEYDADL